MVYRRLKKTLASLALAVLILSSGLVGNSVALAATGHVGTQDRNWGQDRRPDRWEQQRLRREERLELARIREMDREGTSYQDTGANEAKECFPGCDRAGQLQN